VCKPWPTSFEGAISISRLQSRERKIVALAWYLPESFSISARRWQGDLLDGKIRFTVPSLHYWELGNVLRTYVRRGELDPGLALATYQTHLEAPLEPAEPDRSVVLQTALDYEATVNDAVYICLALTLNVSIVTAERSTTSWVVKMGDSIHTVT